MKLDDLAVMRWSTPFVMGMSSVLEAVLTVSCMRRMGGVQSALKNITGKSRSIAVKVSQMV
jgi:hypothetical protein